MQKKLKRIYHTWDKWESFPAGFFDDKPPKGMSVEDCLKAYEVFLRDLSVFERGMREVFAEWPNDCEHNLTNDRMNRIAWLGQSACCKRLGIPSKFKGGYNRLTPEEQKAADALALKLLNEWLSEHGYELTDGKRNHKSANIY